MAKCEECVNFKVINHMLISSEGIVIEEHECVDCKRKTTQVFSWNKDEGKFDFLY